MSLSSFFKFNFSTAASAELPNLFPLAIQSDIFVRSDTINTYVKILTDVSDRIFGIPIGSESILWDNCLQSEAADGLITLLSKAMTDKHDLFLVFKNGVLRKADSVETEVIRNDYKKSGKSKTGIFVSFSHYTRTDFVKIYSCMEYALVCSLNKNVNLSKAIQMKFTDMRSAIGAIDSQAPIEQARKMSKALSDGNDIMMDVKDMIETAQPKMDAIEKAMQFIEAKKSFYLGMPLSYINGEQTGGIGSTGEADTKAVERGLKSYYVSIMKPTIEAILSIKTTFKSQDFRLLTQALETIKTFDLVSEDLITFKNKQLIVSRLLDIDADNLPTKPSVEAASPGIQNQTPPNQQPNGQSGGA